VTPSSGAHKHCSGWQGDYAACSGSCVLATGALDSCSNLGYCFPSGSKTFAVVDPPSESGAGCALVKGLCCLVCLLQLRLGVIQGP
jgi:hypothetical protein